MVSLAADFIRAVGHVDEGPVEEKKLEGPQNSQLSLASFIPVPAKSSIPKLDLKSAVSFQAGAEGDKSMLDDDEVAFPVQREK